MTLNQTSFELGTINENFYNSSTIRTMTSNAVNEHDNLFYQRVSQAAVTAWTLISLVGLLSNIFVLIVLMRTKKNQVYEIFCMGLAITDIAFLLITVPITCVNFIYISWNFDDFLCKFSNFVIMVTVFASAIMLLGLTTSRFLAVVHPWQNRKMQQTEAKLACLLAWLIGALFSVPQPIYFHVKTTTNSSVCIDNFPSEDSRAAYAIFTAAMTYVIPFLSIVTMNFLIVRKLQSEKNNSNTGSAAADAKRIKKKRLRQRVTKVVFLITSLYCICWLPTEVVQLWYNMFRNKFPFTQEMFVIKVISQALSYASCCINPLVYSVISGSFKSAMIKQFPSFGKMLSSRRSQGYQENNTSVSRINGNILLTKVINGEDTSQLYTQIYTNDSPNDAICSSLQSLEASSIASLENRDREAHVASVEVNAINDLYLLDEINNESVSENFDKVTAI